MKKYQLGVLGLSEGRSIISAARASDSWEVRAICDLNEELGLAREREFELDCFTNSYEQMLEDSRIDVIGIYTPDELHATHAMQALAAGKHVVCTKPLLPNLSQARELRDAVARSGRRLFVGQSSRFFEPMIHQRHDFEQGRHGELLTVEAHYHADHRWFTRGRSWARGGGLKWLFGGLSHPVDLVRWYLPDIDEVMGYGLLSPGNRELGHIHPDTMHFVMKSASGIIARASGVYGSPPMNPQRQDNMSCVIRGMLGTSEANYHSLRYFTNFEGQPAAEYDFEDRSDYYFRFGGHSHHAGEYQNYIEYFASCLDAGTVPKPDIDEGLGTVALMVALERAMESGKPQSVPAIMAEYGLT